MTAVIRVPMLVTSVSNVRQALTEKMVVQMNKVHVMGTPAIAEMLSIVIVAKIKTVTIQPISIFMGVASVVNRGGKTKMVMVSPIPIIVEEMLRVNPGTKIKTMRMLSTVIVPEIQVVMIQPMPITVEVASMVNCVAKTNGMRI